MKATTLDGRHGAGIVTLVCACSAILVAPSASAQTQAQFDRSEYVARRAMSAPVCEKFGFSVAKDFGPAGRDLYLELSRSGLADAAAETMAVEAINRHLQAFKIDIGQMDGTTEAGRAALQPMFLKYAKLCVESSRDSLLGKYVKAPAGFDPAVGATAAADELLSAGGFASWQNPQMVARADLLMAAGACRTRIGAERSDGIFQTYSRADDPRERAYYAAYRSGLDDRELQDLDETQCNRVIASFTARVGPPPPLSGRR